MALKSGRVHAATLAVESRKIANRIESVDDRNQLFVQLIAAWEQAEIEGCNPGIIMIAERMDDAARTMLFEMVAAARSYARMDLTLSMAKDWYQRSIADKAKLENELAEVNDAIQKLQNEQAALESVVAAFEQAKQIDLSSAQRQPQSEHDECKFKTLSAEERAYRRGLQAGLQKGRQEGLQEGLQVGEARGEARGEQRGRQWGLQKARAELKRRETASMHRLDVVETKAIHPPQVSDAIVPSKSPVCRPPTATEMYLLVFLRRRRFECLSPLVLRAFFDLWQRHQLSKNVPHAQLWAVNLWETANWRKWEERLELVRRCMT